MTERPGRRSARRGGAEQPEPRAESAPPPRAPTPASYQQAPSHRAGFLDEETLTRLATKDVFVAGQPRPKAHLAAGHAKHQGDLAAGLGLSPADDISTFDPVNHARSFLSDSRDSFKLRLPVTLQLDYGETLTISSTSDIWRDVPKFSRPACTCAAPGGQFTAHKNCKACSNRVTALVQCMDGTTRTLEDAGYVKGGASAQTEVLLALVMTARKARVGGASARSCVPECFAPSRPTGGKVTTTVSEAEGGFPASHAHAGARGVAAWACGFEAPGGGICGVELELSWSDAAPCELDVTVGAGTHLHVAGLCASLLTERCGSACRGWGYTPLALPAGAPSSLHMAVLHTKAINLLRGFDAGAEERPQALSYAAAKLAPPLAVLNRNFAFIGTPRQWEEEKKRARERTLIRQGVQPVPPPPDGPPDMRGRTAWQLGMLAAKKAMSQKPHLGPVILCDLSDPIAVVLSTPNRIDFLGQLHNVHRHPRPGLQLDATGGIVRHDGIDFLHVALVYQLPQAAGGGRVIVALLITSSRAEAPMVGFLEAVNRAVYKHCGVKLLPPHCTSDQDEATLNAECRVWNGMSFDKTLQEIKNRLWALAESLFENDLLGVPLDEDNPPPIGLPIPGFQLNSDGTIVPLLAHDLMVPLLCTAHFINTSIDYIEHNSVVFKHCATKDRGFYTTMLLNMLYPALVSPLFVGVEAYFFLESYCEEMREILRLSSTLKEGTVYDGLVATALVRRGTPEDAHPGKPTPRYVFNVKIKGIAKPIITVRCPSLADADKCCELVSSPEADAAMRARALSRLPGAAESYAQVATEDLPAQEGYRAPPEDGPEAPAGGRAAGGAPAAAPAAAAAAGPAAAPAAAPATAAAAAGLQASELARSIRNPLFVHVLHDRKVHAPLLIAWELRARVMVVAGPTFRGEFDELAFRGNAGAGVELSHKDEKNLWHTHAQLPMPLVQNVASTIEAMKTEEPSVMLKLATITDPVTLEAVRRMHNGAMHKPVPKKVVPKPRPGTAAAATAARAAEATARKEANSTPLSPVGIVRARATAALPAVGEAPDQQWGTARSAAVVAAASRRTAAAEQDAPARAPTLVQMIAQQRARAAPAAAEAEQLEVQADDVALVLKTVRRLPQVGDRAAAKSVDTLAKLGDELLKAQAQLAAKVQAFRVGAQVAADATVAAATAAGYVAPAAPDSLMPLGRGRGKSVPRR